MAGLTIDAGGLIAADRGDPAFWALWEVLRLVDKVVPAPVVAQVWRGPRNARMAMVLRACYVEPMSPGLARQVGELCGRAGTTDIVDATVAVSAASRGDDILTSDPVDIGRLHGLLGGRGRVKTL